LVSRDTLIPIAIVGVVFGVGILLTVLGHRRQLDDLNLDADVDRAIVERVIQLQDVASGQDLRVSAASSINDRGSIAELVATSAFRILLELKDPIVSAGLVTDHGSFTYGTRKICGLNEAADLVFGTTAELLSDPEISLFCYWAVNGQDTWGPEAILATRRLVLRRLLAGRVITEHQFMHYDTKSLALRPTPIPIN
jgi:hypothetical protein